jgi:DNA-binding protein HU-beta
MTKAELISAIAAQSGLTKASSEKAVSAIVAAVTGCLKKGDKLTIVGFGTFNTAKRAARKGLNPQTGKKITIPAATVPRFKAGKGLKELVNKKK